MKKVVLAFLVLLAGCKSNSRFVEGTSVQLGAYVPWESNLYGVELVSYVNGCALKTSSNMNFRVERIYNATNEYLWGAVKTQEHTDTKIEVSKPQVSPTIY